MDAQALYIQLGRLTENIPNFSTPRPFPASTHQWLARLYALLTAFGYHADASRIRDLTSSMASSSSISEINEIHAILFRNLAVAELAAPAPLHGTFIPVGNAFDALTAVGTVFKEAKTDLLIIDPYLDEKVLTDFAPQVLEGVSIRLLSDKEGHKATLKPAVSRWIAQYSTKRPLQARLATQGLLHDRLIFVDNDRSWIITQSLNAFATRSPASIIRSDPDTVALKISAYQAIWDSAAPL